MDRRSGSRESRVERPPEPGVFGQEDLAGLPEPVRRHLAAAVAPGTPLARSARLRMQGAIKIGRWLPFRAREVLTPLDGFVWTARAAGVVVGSDRYVDGVGRAHWTLAGLVTVMHAEGPDVTRSAAGRAGAEGIWLPTALLPRFGVAWTADGPDRITAHYDVGGVPVAMRYRLAPDGRVTSFVFDRWGDPAGTGAWSPYPFGGEVDAHATFEGVTVPSAGRIGWFPGTERWATGEFFRYRITDLRLVGAGGGDAARSPRPSRGP